jgi:competence protein ComEA
MAARPVDAAARTPPPADHAPAFDPEVDRAVPFDPTPHRAPSWLPGADFDRHVPRRDTTRGWRDRLRWDPGRRGAAALGVLLIAAVAATGWWLAASRPHEVPISGPAPTPATISSSPVSATPGSTAPSPSVSAMPTGQPIIVDVAGKVRHPGIYQLKSGARVYDALRAAGGPRPGVSTVSLNLAELIHDGEQILVGAPSNGSGGVGSGASAAESGSASGAATIVDLNTATLEQLETLPGVGPVLGQHILDWRDAHGQFASADQLREVSGIGDVRFAQLRPLVTT